MPNDALEKARGLADEGRVEEAREILEQITTREPSNEAAWLLFLDLSARNEAERVESLRQYVFEHPGSQQAREALRNLESRLSRSPRGLVPARPGLAHQPITRPRRAVLERFRRGPVNVSTRLPPGTVASWFYRGLLIVILAIITLLAVLPIWDGRNLFSYLRSNLPMLPGVRTLLDDRPAATPVPGPDSVLFADLTSVCPWERDVPAGATVRELSGRFPAGRLAETALEGLSRYYGIWWELPDQRVWGCELMVYDSGPDAQEAYPAVEDMILASGERVRLDFAPRGSVSTLIVGRQVVHNLGYRDGRVILLLSSIAPDQESGRTALEELWQHLRSRLDPVDTR